MATKKKASTTPTKRPAKKAPAKKAPAKRTAARRKPRAEARPAPAIEEVIEVEPVSTVPLVAEPVLEEAVPKDTFPEIGFVARVPPPPTERPRPVHRRAIFFDVENTSRSSDVTRMLEQLAIDRFGTDTELIASGNWRVIGGETARLLARNGAQLVHSAPTVGVRDWSDLRIAVSAGMWLASTRPGDRIDIVSDDKAFDVVGDVAAIMGVEFMRHSFRAAMRAAAAQRTGERTERPERAAGTRTRRRKGSERPAARRERPAEAASPTPAPVPAPAEVAREPRVREAPTARAEPRTEPGTAPADELLSLVSELVSEKPNGVMLDVVAKQLKERGFIRPPGSPRLVTRLRSFKELDVSPRGLIRLRKGVEPAIVTAEATAEPELTAAQENEATEGAPAEAKRRRRRRGGRSRPKPSPATE